MTVKFRLSRITRTSSLTGNVTRRLGKLIISFLIPISMSALALDNINDGETVTVPGDVGSNGAEFTH
ncbi:hypothetical protein [Yersinia sp. 1652 StPb PI]|uniref:hypothetical protein n=1 Tax=Yersinia sp. 1652 StPb PI TaxID=3061649 RepID=UPI00355C5EF0